MTRRYLAGLLVTTGLVVISPACASYEQGTASYYADALDGRRTASGERYDLDKLTAAHPDLEFGTRVEVTNLDNGKSVIVRINDRGPYVDDRVIDLSRAAAEAIDITEDGLAEVSLEVLD